MSKLCVYIMYYHHIYMLHHTASVNSNDVPLEELPSQADGTRLVQFVRMFFSQTKVSSLHSTDGHNTPISGYHRDTIHM